MPADHAITDLSLPGAVLDKLFDLSIRSVRQLYARLRREGRSLQDYLELSDRAFADLLHRVEDIIRRDFPDDLTAQTHPRVSKTGVAVHRLHDPSRPRFRAHQTEE